MFSKNILLLFCVVCFVEKCCSTDKWRENLEKHHDNGDGLIDAVELQKLIFQKCKGFVTVRLADIYIPFINLNGSNQITFAEFERMAPLINVLSEREKSEANDDVNGNKTISVKQARDVLWRVFYGLFENRKEISEVFKIFGLNEEDPIERETFEEIEETLKSTRKLNETHTLFCYLDKDKNKVLSAEEVSTAIIEKYDINRDNKIDFTEFVSYCHRPGAGEQVFIIQFGKSHITREELNDFLFREFKTRLTVYDLDEIDPSSKNNISYQDFKKWLNKI
ncbi:uncharacterized protein LOC126836335 [Adelges cooleyi]|uniref:uncharacterized protein LOC126836335 n=1 Tax=Adelges cooleyi TaxID=133065 RepID=UPI00217FB3C7|nr:uncharacterized protein LOC126836335 [Adelges cooleyi]